MSAGRYEMYMMATARADRNEEMARARRRPVFSWIHPPKTEPPIAPMGEAMFQRASQFEGRIHLPSWRMPKSFLRGVSVVVVISRRGWGPKGILEDGHGRDGANDDIVVAVKQDCRCEGKGDIGDLAVLFHVLPEGALVVAGFCREGAGGAADFGHVLGRRVGLAVHAGGVG